MAKIFYSLRMVFMALISGWLLKRTISPMVMVSRRARLCL
jgi:hypothetical protein